MSKINKEETNDWHRYFAVETNNRAWQLATQPRTAEEDSELLDAAHSAAFHWNKVGTELNKMRATMLLAEVHALLNLGETALQYAEQMKQFFLSNDDTPDWEIAFVHTIHAHAAHASANEEQYRLSYALAKQAIEQIVDDDDRAIVLETFEQVPIPK